MTFSQYVLDAISSVDYVSKDHDYDSVSLLRELSDKAPNETDIHILEVIAGASSMYYNEKEHSFGPLIIMDGKRTFAPEDIDESDLDILKSIIPITGSHYIRTKFSHVVWLLTKDNRYGEIAINGYLDGFQNRFDPDKWVPCYGQIKRAYHIALVMGKKSESFKKTLSEINQTLTQLNGSDSSFLSLKLLKLTIKDAPGEDLIKYEPIIKNIASRSFCAANDNAYFADETFFVFKKLYERLQKNEEIKALKERYARYYEDQASKRNNSNSCSAKEIDARMIDSFVISELRKFLYNEEAIREITKEINEAAKKRIKEKKDSIGALKKELDKLRHAQKNVLDAIVSMGISPALREKLDEIESEIKLREQQINDAEHTAESFIPVNPAAVKSCIKDMKNVLKKADFESIKRLIFDFVERVTVYSDHVEVIFKLPVPLNPELVKPALCKTVSKTTDHIMINHSA